MVLDPMQIFLVYGKGLHGWKASVRGSANEMRDSFHRVSVLSFKYEFVQKRYIKNLANQRGGRVENFKVLFDSGSKMGDEHGDFFVTISVAVDYLSKDEIKRATLEVGRSTEITFTISKVP